MKKEFERELDWSKIPKWTKIQVRTSIYQEYKNRYFLEYVDGVVKKVCRATVCDEFTFRENLFFDYKYFRIHPSVEIKNEWYKV